MAAASSSSGASKNATHKKALKDLIQLMIDIFNEWDLMYSTDSGKRINPLRGYILSYQKLLNPRSKKVDVSFDFEQDHAPLFRRFFEQNSKWLLNIADGGDLTLRDGSHQIWFGEAVPRIKKRNYRLPLSAMYKKAYQMWEAAESKKLGDPELDAKIESELRYVLAGEFRYQLLNVIHIALPDDHPHKDELEELVQELREEAGLDVDGGSGSSMSSLLGGLAKDALAIAKNAGIKGENGEELNEDSLSSIETLGATASRFVGSSKIIDGLTTAAKAIPEIMNSETATASEAYSKLFEKLKPTLDEATDDMMRPPEGVELTPESAAEAEELRKNFKGVINGVGKFMSQVKPSAIRDAVTTMTEAVEGEGEYSDEEE